MMRKIGVRVASALKQFALHLVDPMVSIFFALIAGAVLISVLGTSVGQAYSALWSGSFGTRKAIAQTLISATPLMFTAFAFSIAYRAGVFNLGGEGQFYAGAIMGAWMGFALKGLPPVLHVLIVILAGAAGGALFGAIPALLKAKRGVNEVITCIMLNYIAINITNYLVSTKGPLLCGSTQPATPMIEESAKLPVILEGTRLTCGILIAIFFAVVLYIYMWRTRAGYKARAVGLNPLAAACGGIPVTRYAISTMVLAGALAGIGGAIEIIAVHNRFYANFSSGYGFEGVAVGMLGGNHPFGIILSGILYGGLKSGATAMQISAGTNAELVKVLQAFVIFFIACKWSVVTLVKNLAKKRKAMAAAKKTKEAE